MYRDREYSKSVQFWIEVVCKNIIDVYPQLSTNLLALLVEVYLWLSLKSPKVVIWSEIQLCSSVIYTHYDLR